MQRAEGAIALKGARNARACEHHIMYTKMSCCESRVQSVKPEQRRVWEWEWGWGRERVVPSLQTLEHKAGSAGVQQYLQSPSRPRRRQPRAPRGRAQKGALLLEPRPTLASAHASSRDLPDPSRRCQKSLLERCRQPPRWVAYPAHRSLLCLIPGRKVMSSALCNKILSCGYIWI